MAILEDQLGTLAFNKEDTLAARTGADSIGEATDNNVFLSVPFVL